MRVAPLPDRPWQIQGEELTILKNAVCKGASDAELQYCLTVAKRYKLDPFKKQIWFVPRWDKEADNGQGGKGARVWIPTVGIDGLLFMGARDHKEDFGSIAEPEFGPMHKPEGQKFDAPTWARAKVFKKGIAEPTTAVAYWDEYAPFDLTKAPFWRNMPRRMISKCAKALALREAYPDMGGVYIPEELERMGSEYTESGRQITAGVPTGGSHEAAQAVAQRKIAEAREKPIQAEIVQEKPAVREWQGDVELDWTDEASPILRGDIGNLLEALKPHCTLTWGKDSWWHCVPRDAEVIRAACDQLSFRLTEVMPKRLPSSEGKSGAQQGKADVAGKSARPASAPTNSRKEEKVTVSTTADAADTKNNQMGGVEPFVVKGTIEQFSEKMTRGRKADPDKGIKARASSPYLTVLIKTEKGSQWCSLFDKELFHYIDKGKIKKQGEFVVSKSGEFWNLVGFKTLEALHFDDDHKTVALQRDREAGSPTLFGT